MSSTAETVDVTATPSFFSTLFQSRYAIAALVVLIVVLLGVCYYLYHKNVKQQKVIDMMNDTHDRMAQDLFRHNPAFVNTSRLAKGHTLNPLYRKQSESPHDEQLTVQTKIHPRSATSAKPRSAPPPPKTTVIIEDEDEQDDEDEDAPEPLIAATRKTVVVGF